jgi:hypothetical protein
MAAKVFAGSSQTMWFSAENVEWRVRTDKTERPEIGASSLAVAVEKTVRAHGLLHALQGKRGTVGFALIEAQALVDASATRDLCFRFSGGPCGAHFQVLLKDDQSDQPNGTLTFQSNFVATGKSENICLPLLGFVATIRGAEVPSFVLNRRALRSFSIQISRSRLEGPLLSQSPLSFWFTLEGEVQLSHFKKVEE